MDTKPKVLKWALIIGIVVVLNLFFNYTISLFYKAPDYNVYFPQAQVIEPITTKEACLKVGGQWTENSISTKDVIPTQAPVGTTTPSITPQTNSYCNPDFTKQQDFSNAQKVYERNVFIMLIVLGVISLVLGAFIPNEIIVLSFSWGGVLSLIIASMRYWSVADSIIKVVILGIALGALIWLAVKKFNK